MNLLEETKEKLEDHGKKLSDITFVQGKLFGIPVDKFIELANTEYDGGFGVQEVANDLIVGGDDWWLERHEYDGSEWWEYKEYPIHLPINDSIYTLTSDFGKTLAEINENRKKRMTPFEHLKAKLEHAKKIDAVAAMVDVEELTSVLDELEGARTKAIDEYMNELCNSCIQKPCGCLEYPFADGGCEIAKIAERLKEKAE